MKIRCSCKKKLAALFGLLIFGLSNAHASSTFNNQAAISFTVNTVPSGLAIDGLFELAASDSGIVEGDGNLSTNYPSVLPTITGSDYTFDNFSVSGAASNGGIYNSSHTGWYSLDFTNNSATTIGVSLTFNYTLSAITSGQFADSNVGLDYYLGNAFPENINVYSSVFGDLNSGASSSKLISFNLAPGESQTFHADVTINGSLEAVSSVPLPAAVWSFLAGLIGVLGLKKRKQQPHDIM